MSLFRVAVVGAGWAGATVARVLHDAGVRVEVFERALVTGGQSRVETINDVVYEPNGAHIFHTSRPDVARFVQRFGMTRAYEHKVLTEVYPDEDADESMFLSWPPQVSELRRLPQWGRIAGELERLPTRPAGDDFETWVISLMGPTLYSLFIENYTRKQWGCEPSELSSRFAPKRVELRSDGDRRLFRDRWEYFPERGVNPIFDRVLSPIELHAGQRIDVGDLDDLARSFEHLVVTAALDDFLGRDGTLEWRGIKMKSRFVPTERREDTVTPAYVVNRPSYRVPHTRTVETKHATGQRVFGTIVSEELPGQPARHYPVPTVDRRNERTNETMRTEILEASPMPVSFCGRLANYQYINQDEAIGQGFACAQAVLEQSGQRPNRLAS